MYRRDIRSLEIFSSGGDPVRSSCRIACLLLGGLDRRALARLLAHAIAHPPGPPELPNSIGRASDLTLWRSKAEIS